MNSNNDLVIFGARGDLAERKLLPALYQLDRAGLLEDEMRIAGLARQAVTTEEFVGNTHENLNKYVPESDWDEECWTRFSSRLTYVKVDFSKLEEYQNLKQWLNEERTQIYYMATPPSIFGSICENLDSAGCVFDSSRIVLEKPIGHDLKSSKEVNGTVGEFFPERNIYRIDHYLGKETVQNLLALRFANRMINSQWDNTVSIISRLLPQKLWVLRDAGLTTIRSASCAIWFRTTCCNCCAWWLWSRQIHYRPMRFVLRK